MVTRGNFSEEELTFRRYGPRGQSYPLAQERSEHPYGSRTYNDGRGNDRGPENTEPGPHQMRRRIQVAVCHSSFCLPHCELSTDLNIFTDQTFS